MKEVQIEKRCRQAEPASSQGLFRNTNNGFECRTTGLRGNRVRLGEGCVFIIGAIQTTDVQPMFLISHNKLSLSAGVPVARTFLIFFSHYKPGNVEG